MAWITLSGVDESIVWIFPVVSGVGNRWITRISQLQLLQPFFTLLVASVWLGEAIEFETLGFATAVVVTVFVGKHYF